MKTVKKNVAAPKTAPKTAAKPTPKAAPKAVKKATAVKPAPAPKFPTKELKTWLTGRTEWNHDQWLTLLEDLRSKGYGTLTDTQEGRESIGLFIEANRAK